MPGMLDTAQAPSLAPEELAQRWSDVVNDPVLRNLPYRIELNKWGHIEMTAPASPMHMRLATRVAAVLERTLGGEAFTECAIATLGGVKVADVAWCSNDFLQRLRGAFSSWEASLPEAPELCVEVMSPTNLAAELKEKCTLYLEAGARETWILYPDLVIEIRDLSGPREDLPCSTISGLCKPSCAACRQLHIKPHPSPRSSVGPLCHGGLRFAADARSLSSSPAMTRTGNVRDTLARAQCKCASATIKTAWR